MPRMGEMRQSMRHLLIVLSALVLEACATVPRELPEPGPRTVQELTDGWLFRFDDSWDEPAARSASATAWQPVRLPHSWNRLGEYRLERTSATDDRQGKGWYRLAIDGRTLDRRKRHVMEFDAVGNVADVWLNGRHLGRHKGAFSRFRFDLGGALDLSGPNILVVRADNSSPKPGSATADVIPLQGDFFIHGGIYRPARLISVNPSQFQPLRFRRAGRLCRRCRSRRERRQRRGPHEVGRRTAWAAPRSRHRRAERNSGGAREPGPCGALK